MNFWNFTKRCSACRQYKKWREFCINPWRPDGLRAACKQCEASRAREKRKLEPEKHHEADRKYNLKYGFGIDEATYQEMLARQNGVCAICGHPETAIDKRSGQLKRLSVDHCSGTGAIRSLLCGKCNVGIGMLRHSVTLLESAISYLQSHQKDKPKTNEHLRIT